MESLREISTVNSRMLSVQSNEFICYKEGICHAQQIMPLTFRNIFKYAVDKHTDYMCTYAAMQQLMWKASLTIHINVHHSIHIIWFWEPFFFPGLGSIWHAKEEESVIQIYLFFFQLREKPMTNQFIYYINNVSKPCLLQKCSWQQTRRAEKAVRFGELFPACFSMGRQDCLGHSENIQQAGKSLSPIVIASKWYMGRRIRDST